MRKHLYIRFIFVVTVLSLILSAGLSLSATQTIPESRIVPLVSDNAGLLSESEASNLLSILEEKTQALQCDIAVVTIESLQGYTAQQVADDLYDYCGFGYGANDDGVMFLLAMEEREWYITTYGYPIWALNDSSIQSIGDSVVSYLSNGDYYNAFVKYATVTSEYLRMYRNGDYSYDNYGSKQTESDGNGRILVAGIAGFVIALIATSSMKSKLKTVRTKYNAADYITKDSMKITNRSDMFLYRNVTKVRREHDSGSHGGGHSGGSTHTSSSGRSHGGGGGRF